MVMEQKMQLRLECLVNIRLPREMVALLFCVARCRLRDYILNWTFNEVTALQRSPVSIVIICCLCFSFLHPISRLSVWSVIYEYKQCMFICYYNFLSLHCYCYKCMAWNGPLLYLVNCLLLKCLLYMRTLHNDFSKLNAQLSFSHIYGFIDILYIH